MVFLLYFLVLVFLEQVEMFFLPILSHICIRTYD